MKQIRIWSILLLFATLLQFGAGAFPVSAADGDASVLPHSEEEHSHPQADTPFDLHPYSPHSSSAPSSQPSQKAGDMDGDGDVDVADAVYLLRHVLKPQDYPITQAGDMDGDEDIDVADAVYLLRHTLMPSKYPLQVHIHTVVNQAAVGATCTRSGLTAGSYCSDCGEILEAQKVTPPKGHSSTVVEEIAAGCTEDGMVKEHCDVCDTDFLTRLTYAKGHDFGEAEIQNEATCTMDGLALYVCKTCNHSESILLPAKGHTLIASDATEDGSVIYICGDCGYTTTDSSTVDPNEEEHIFGCDKDFSFDILYDGDEAYIRDHLWISDAYYTDPTPEERLSYELEYKGEGRWTVTPSEDYEGGNTYRAKISGDLKFADYESDELYFTVADELHTNITLSDGIIFIPLPALGTVDRQQYRLETNTDNEFFYLTMPDSGKLGEEHIGRVICAGAYTNMDDFMADNTKECYFGKIEKVYATADGKILLVLSCPELYEIYSELDIYESYIVELTEEDLPDDLGAQAVSALRNSDDFGEFVTGITLAAKTYADDMGAVAVGVEDLRFLDELGLIPTFKIENGNKLVVAIQGNLPIKLKNKENKNCGTITVSFLAKAELSFSVTGVCEFKYFWGIPTSMKEFDFSVTQTSTYTLEFSVKVSLDPIAKPEGKSVVKTPLGIYHLKDCLTISAFPEGSLTAMSNTQLDAAYRKSHGSIEMDCPICNPTMSYLKKNLYVVNKDTNTIHRFVCAESDRLDATNVEMLGSIPAVMNYTLCEVCLRGKSDAEEQNFEELLVDALRYQNWSDIAGKVKKVLTKEDKPAEKESAFDLLKLPIPFAGIFQLSLEAKMVINFKFSGSVSLTYQNTTTTVAGVRLNSGNTLEPYSSRTMKEQSTTFKVAGGLDVKVGIRFQIKAGLKGFLEKFLYIGLGAEVGTYSDLDGILFVQSNTSEENGETEKTTSSFVAAYWEMGLYGDIFFDYNVIIWGNRISIFGGDKRLPLLAIGYDKVYYGYSSTFEELETTGHSVDLTNRPILSANAFDVKKLSSALESLNILGVSGEYDVVITVLDQNGNPSPYCTAVNGVIQISENAPCDLTVTVVVKVIGKKDAVDTLADFFRQGYTVGDDLYKLPDFRFELHVTNHTISEWETVEEPTCTEEGTQHRYSTCDCTHEEFRTVAPLGHDSVTDPAYAATCITDGATEGAHCGRCGEILIAQNILPAFGHSYTDEFTCHDRPCTNKGCTHVEVATTEHRYSRWIDVPMGDCALEAYHIRYCLDCRYTATDLGAEVPTQHKHDIGIPETVYPTCTEDGYITCYCKRCGEELINDILPKTGHDLGDYIITDTGHYQNCQNRGCKYATEVEEHSFIHACDTDCGICGYTRVTGHVWETEYSQSGSDHWFECEICGADGVKEAHRYEENCLVCDICDYLRSGAHRWSDDYLSDGKEHWQICEDCGESGIKNDHTHLVDCTVCDVCHRASGTSHRWAQEYSRDGEHHWYNCESCRQTLSVDAHAYTEAEPLYPASKATCQKAATYYCYCVCGKVGGTTFSYGEIADHSWSSAYTATEEGHYRICTFGCGSVTDAEAHRFGAYEVTKAATCTAVGKESRRCENCDYAESREIPKKAHSYGAAYQFNSVYHWFECDACGDKKDERFHRLGDDLICDDCGYETDEQHDWDPVYRFDDQTHWVVCKDCGILAGEQAHQFENGCDPDCSVCGYTRTTQHRWKADYTADADSHFIECDECGEQKEQGAHVWDHACDTDCNICGRVRKTTHQWSEEYASDDHGHWRSCKVCGEPEGKSAHSGGAATCTKAPICSVCHSSYGAAKGHDFGGAILYDDTHHYQICQNGCGTETERTAHTYGAYQIIQAATCTRVGIETHSCTVCKKSEDREIPMTEHQWSAQWNSDADSHWFDCTACGLDGEKTAHVWDHACDTDCNLCGKVRAITHQWSAEYASDAHGHRRVCDLCGATDSFAPHVWDHACDPDCNVCGRTRTIQHRWSVHYQTDATHHWYECELCHARQGESAHAGGMATCTELAICAICKQTYGETTPHSYVMRVEYSDYLLRSATCEGEGVYYFSCVCGKRGTTTFTVTALGHDWATEYSNNATHHWLDCSRCDKTDGKSSHLGGTATCREQACCTACGIAYGSLGAHDFSVKSVKYIASEATCESPAYYYYTCSSCEIAGTATYAVGIALGHRWSDGYTVTDSKHYVECLNGCGSHRQEGVHLYGNYTETKAPTCTKEGEETRSCTACGHSQTRPIKKLPHELSKEEEIVTDIIPGIGQDLYIHNIVFGCIHCDYYEVQATSTAHVHEAVDYILGTPPTCTENGLTSGVICAVPGCGEVRVAQEVIEAPGHDYLLGICIRCGEEEVHYSEGLLYELSEDGTYYIVAGRGTCTDAEIVIPETYRGLPVREIGNLAFEADYELISIVIPDSVVSIGFSAFDYAANLERVDFGNGVQYIGNSAFVQCFALKSIELPDSLTMLDSYAFYMCRGITQVTIGKGLTSIGESAFWEQESLVGFTVSAENPAYCAINGDLYSKDGSVLLQYAIGKTDTVFVAPEGLQTIDTEAFRGSRYLQSVQLSDSVTTLRRGAFNWITSIQEVYIGVGVKQIEDEVFYGCQNLQTIYYAGTQKQWNAISKGANWDASTGNYALICLGVDGSQGLAYTLSSDGTYYIVSGMGTCTDAEIVIPETYKGLPVREIGHAAFRYEVGITEIVLPNGMTVIDDYAFEGCDDLIFITIPGSVTAIGICAFSDCGKLIEVTLPESLQTLGDYAFYGCVALERIYFNAVKLNDLSVTGMNANYFSINNDVFSYAGTNKNGITVTVGAKVVRIPAYLFYSNQSSAHAPRIGALIFEEGSVCQEIGDHAFRQVDGLVSVRFPASLMTIGSYAFGYTDLKSVQFAEGNLQTIGAWAFRDCKNLSWLQLPDGIKTIDKGALNGCTALVEITLPASLQTLGDQAFYNCTTLERIYFNATQMNDLQSNNYTFGYAGSQGNGISVVIGANVKKIPAYLFCPYYTSEAPKITSVTFASSSQCSEIGTYAFAYCDELAAVTIPESVKTLGDFAFRECTGLTTVYFNAVAMNDISYGGVFDNAGTASGGMTMYVSKDVTRIPGLLFAAHMYSDTYFPYVKTVVFEEGSVCTEIGRYAFSSCSGLAEITIPASVKTIRTNAFRKCLALTTIYYDGTRSGWNSVTKETDWDVNTGEYTVVYLAGDGSEGLAYALSSDGSYYIVTGMGSCTDTEVVIPARYNGKLVRKICDDAFVDQTQIEEITLPEGLTEIGDYAFGWCSGLKKVYLPSSLSTVGISAFHQCYELTGVYISDINAWASINFSAYEGSNPLEYAGNLYLNGSILTNLVIENISKIGQYSFYCCTSLKSITIGVGVLEIGERAFCGCKAITSIEIGNDVTILKEGAFQACINANRLICGNNIQRIESYAFIYCYGLTTVILPDGLVSIGEYAFSSCSSLKALVIPKSVTEIGEWAVEYQYETVIYYMGTETEWNKITTSESDHINWWVDRYYYSSTRPTSNASQYWHYINGIPTVWS